MINSDLDRRDFVKLGAGVVSAFALAPAASAFLRPLESDQDVQVAMIGAGKQGRVLLGELQKFDFVKVRAICDTDARRLKSAARRAPEAKGYANYKELLDKEKDIKAVFLATPSHLHKDIAIDVMSAGKHLYCEAPMATTIEDAKAIAKAASQSKALFHAGLQLRANPIYKLARSFLRSGAINDIVSLRGQYHKKTSMRVRASDPSKDKKFNWALYKETSIGLPGEVGVHSIDAMNWFTKKRPQSVEGWGEIMLYNDGRDMPDTVNCILTYPDGVKLLYDATLANSFDGRFEQYNGSMGTIKTIGTLGWMFKEADARTQGWEVYAIRQHFHKEEGITLIADATKLAKQGKLKAGVGLPNTPLYYGVEDFLKGIVENKTKTACSARIGLESAVIVIKTNEAVLTGNKIDLLDEWFEIA